ncbi:DNA-binding domain-containing protein [Alloalcanivorax xenomutans]|uniref:HvfC family RiPP maturation protein n=1 Tax=Alloalcanivorax xenomutans TaxID=1094342 RepID=UPI003BA92A08
MSEPDFVAVQRRFAAHLRDPDRHAAPEGLEDRRLAVYRDLFFNNVQGILSQGFPVLHGVLPEDRWRALVRAFFHRHRSHSPYFLQIPGEFVAFLAGEYQPDPQDPPYLAELAHYEWMEVVLDTATEEIPQRGYDPDGDLLAGVPVLNPLHVLQGYRFPVHRIGPDYRPDRPLAEPVWLLIHRDRDDRVRFTELNPATARMLQLMAASPEEQGEAVLTRLAEELNFADQSALHGFAVELLEQLRGKHVILGAR